MHALIVVAHHDRDSLTHGIAARVGEGLSTTNQGSTYAIADLHAEGFDPRFTAGDLAVHHNEALPPSDIRVEQQRIDRADALVLVYPVYWWSMPALLKGWIDRVFSNGWAFEFRPNAPLIKKLGHLSIHLLGVGGADPDTYDRHGYATAMKTQIDHGIFNYCGAKVMTSELMLESETENPMVHLASAFSIGRQLFDVKT
ncbi:MULTISPECIES: NAD(P)H-dependent oxidoreductase [Pseudomonas]|uniref:NAD(P)H-dependent oxidoreductase n=1 Tax=Pseudomonas gingeri TaxID=117681 RepID=A0A7Y7WQD7_9PSED|nr:MULTISPECIES: NAD(P)H-dependent oxidoreductase [Pseudomonas]NWB85799.1 NAD(P)H-dependent oxidoreductase [Pseudomonas gingeri]